MYYEYKHSMYMYIHTGMYANSMIVNTHTHTHTHNHFGNTSWLLIMRENIYYSLSASHYSAASTNLHQQSSSLSRIPNIPEDNENTNRTCHKR